MSLDKWPSISELMEKGSFVDLAGPEDELWNVYEFNGQYFGLMPPYEWIALMKVKQAAS